MCLHTFNAHEKHGKTRLSRHMAGTLYARSMTTGYVSQSRVFPYVDSPLYPESVSDEEMPTADVLIFKWVLRLISHSLDK